MKKIKVAVFDADKGYRERFSDYLMSYKAKEMELSVFTGVQFLLEALELSTYHLIVVGDGYESILADLKLRKIPILILAEVGQSYVKESSGLEDLVAYTSKYQPMDEITKQMQVMAKCEAVHRDVHWMTRQMEIVGVVSPVKHEMQLFFSLLYGKNSAKRGKVLYLNLLEYSGFSEMTESAAFDIGDVILQLRETTVSPEKVLACIGEWEGISYIAPPLNPEQLGEITAEDVECLIQFLAEFTDYHTIIFDIGLMVKDLTEILLKCSKMYCITKRGYFYELQTRQFLTYLEQIVDVGFVQRLEKLELSYHLQTVCRGRQLLEQLDWSEFGDVVRGVIRGERRCSRDS